MRLDLGVETTEEDGSHVIIRVDGRPLDEVLGVSRYVGFDPDDLFAADEPLLPGDDARRVAVEKCICGEPGCGTVAPMIERRGDRVIWRDARDLVGVFHHPGDDAGDIEGTPLSPVELDFDAVQYEAEVRRAAHDRTWESDDRRIARLLRVTLAAEWSSLGGDHIRLGWVIPSWGPRRTWIVETRPASESESRFPQVFAEVSTEVRDPEPAASDLARQLLRVPVEEWSAAFPQDR